MHAAEAPDRDDQAREHLVHHVLGRRRIAEHAQGQGVTRAPVVRVEARQRRRFAARRGGDQGGVLFWIGQLNGGATRNSIRQQFIASPEFQGRVAAIVAQGCLR